MAPRPERKNRTCCCCIPTRIGVAILAWLYFLGGIAATVLAVMVFIRTELTIYTMDGALVIVLAALSGFVAVAAAFGIAATITQSPSLAKVFSGLFIFWFYLQVAFDIAIIALLFAKKLDHFVSECGYQRPTNRQERNCDRARSRTSLFYTIQAVIRAAIGFYFTRRVSSYTRHCSELADPELHNHLQMMAASAKAPAVGAGTTFASNMPTVVQRQPYDAQTPTPGHASFTSQGLNAQGGYPGQFQASSDSIQGAEQVKEAPQEYNNATAKAV